MAVFDTHAHYDSGAFNADRLEVLASMPGCGVELILNPGCDLESSKTALELADRFPYVYAGSRGSTPPTVETGKTGLYWSCGRWPPTRRSGPLERSDWTTTGRITRLGPYSRMSFAASWSWPQSLPSARYRP